MSLIDKNRAVSYFRSKMEFSLGPAELDHLIRDHADVTIMDVRAEDDYRKGHLPRAINVPKNRWDSFTGLSQTRRHIIYCYTQQCHLATEACLKFSVRGFRVMELEGGMEAWRQFGFQVESGEPAVRKAA